MNPTSEIIKVKIQLFLILKKKLIFYYLLFNLKI